MSKVIIAMVLSSGRVLAQSPTGEISGFIRDQTGALVPGAEITVTNENTGQSKSVTSSGTGDYLVPQLAAGIYRISVRTSGFRSVERRNLTLTALQSLRVDLILEVGEVTETVTVDADAPQVDTRNYSQGMLVDDRRIRDLPLNGRNLIDLAHLVPGVTSVGTTIRPDFGQQTIRFNGGRHVSVNFLMDGGSIGSGTGAAAARCHPGIQGGHYGRDGGIRPRFRGSQRGYAFRQQFLSRKRVGIPP